MAREDQDRAYGIDGGTGKGLDGGADTGIDGGADTGIGGGTDTGTGTGIGTGASTVVAGSSGTSMAMRRWMAISLPWWPTDLVRRKLMADGKQSVDGRRWMNGRSDAGGGAGANRRGSTGERGVAAAGKGRVVTPGERGVVAPGKREVVTPGKGGGRPADEQESPGSEKREAWGGSADARGDLDDAQAPILIHRQDRNASRVVAVCPLAHAAGARCGMPLAEAKAICGAGVITRPWDPRSDARALHRLAQWCTRYAPLVMPVADPCGDRIIAAADTMGAPPDRHGVVAGGSGGVRGTGAQSINGPSFTGLEVASRTPTGRAGRGGSGALPALRAPLIVVDVTGCELVHGGESALVLRVRRDLERRGVQSRVVIAPTQRAAMAASTQGSGVLGGDPRTVAESLGALPLWTLGLSESSLEALREVNVRSIGEALHLPRRALADRFAPELLKALDELRGDRAEPFEPLPHARMIKVDMAFDGPTTRLDAVAMAVRRTLDRFCAALARRERGVRLLELSLRRVDALPIVDRIALGRASRHAKHLWTLLAPRIETANMGFGVEGVRLRALIDAPQPFQQQRWSDPPHAPRAVTAGGLAGAVVEESRAESIHDAGMSRQLSEMLDQVAARFGAEMVRRLTLSADDPGMIPMTDGWIEAPERHPGGAAARRSGGGSAPRGLRHPDDRRAESAHDRLVRPTLVFERALAAEVVAEEGPGARRPIEVRWPGGGGRVVECDGPERYAARWWLEGASVGERDLWRIRTMDGRWLWLLHVRPDRWSVIGAWT